MDRKDKLQKSLEKNLPVVPEAQEINILLGIFSKENTTWYVETLTYLTIPQHILLDFPR